MPDLVPNLMPDLVPKQLRAICSKNAFYISIFFCVFQSMYVRGGTRQAKVASTSFADKTVCARDNAELMTRVKRDF